MRSPISSKKGDAEVGVGGPLEGAWDRLDSWELFKEPYRLVVGNKHRLASLGDPIAPSELSKERFLCRTNCENSKDILGFLDAHGGQPKAKHDVATEPDLAALLESNFGIGIAPRSSVLSANSRQLRIDGLEIDRTVYAYAVAGRQRSMAASTLIKMLRAADWRVVEKQLVGVDKGSDVSVSSQVA